MRRTILLSAVIALTIAESMTFPFGKNKINLHPAHWMILKTAHFTIYYPKGSDELARHAARITEEGYLHVSDYLRHGLTRSVPVILFPTRVDFQNNNILPAITGESIGGFTESMKNRVVVPYAGSFRSFRYVLTHELVHAFQFNMLYADRTGRRPPWFLPRDLPLWLMEGMAEYLSLGFDDAVDTYMRDAIVNDRFVGIADLNRMNIRSISTIYKEGQAFYYFLETYYGREAIGELFRDIRDLGNAEEALKVHTGKSIPELNDQWLRFYKRRYFPLVTGKTFDDEEGERITDHEKTGTSLNAYPAVSPDGTKIAYMSNRDVDVTLVIMDLKDGRRMERTILRGNRSAGFEEMLVRNNTLSWSADGTGIVFVAQSTGHDTIYMVDARDGSIRRRITSPLAAVMDPCMKPDGSAVVFSGVEGLYSNIYVYTLADKKLKRITEDGNSDRFPRITPDGKEVIFSSKGDTPDDVNASYDIVRLDMATGRRETLVATPGNDVHPDISQDGRYLVYASNRSGIYNLYRLDLKEGRTDKLTDTLTAIYNPRWFPDGRKVSYVTYQRLGYDVYVKDLEISQTYREGEEPVLRHYPAGHPSVSPGEMRMRSVDYGLDIVPDWFSLGATAAVGYGILAFAQLGVSDYLGEHRLVLTGNYLREGERNYGNYDIEYRYLKYRWDVGVGAFRRTNPFALLYRDDINDLSQTVNYGSESMDHYGVRLTAIYPFSRFLRLETVASMERHEVSYSPWEAGRGARGTQGQLSVFMVYDNVRWGGFVPVDGFRGTLGFQQSAGLAGSDLTHTGISSDCRLYLPVSGLNVVALRFAGGMTLGPGGEYFRYHLGGYNTLRGFDLFSFQGKFMFLMNAEFRFTLLEDLRLGWPLYHTLGDIGCVLFADLGSAWNGRYVLYNRGDGRLEDLKIDIGFGFRFVIYPVTILKLDFAWPYDTNSFGNAEILVSLGMEF
ncbi:MAG: PD40 domain-containing protein [Spirochaetes bacterium]|nr:PD40 domain-containing protein [Spirochaetota bacterium]